MIQKPLLHRFDETLELEDFQLQVRPEYTISHDPDVTRGKIKEEIEELRRESRDNPDKVYFPGTFNEHSGGYFHTTMPIVANGRVVKNRKKVKTHFDIHDWSRAASELDMDDERTLIAEAERTLENPENSYMKKGRAKNIDAFLYKDPKGPVSRNLQEKAKEEARETLGSIRVNDYEVLPVICNELSRIELDEGTEPDVIVESSYDLPNWQEDYEKFARKNDIDSAYVLRADGACPEESGVYQIKSGEIKEGSL